jgi:hypothetical protein
MSAKPPGIAAAATTGAGCRRHAVGGDQIEEGSAAKPPRLRHRGGGIDHVWPTSERRPVSLSSEQGEASPRPPASHRPGSSALITPACPKPWNRRGHEGRSGVPRIREGLDLGQRQGPATGRRSATPPSRSGDAPSQRHPSRNVGQAARRSARSGRSLSPPVRTGCSQQDHRHRASPRRTPLPTGNIAGHRLKPPKQQGAPHRAHRERGSMPWGAESDCTPPQPARRSMTMKQCRSSGNRPGRHRRATGRSDRLTPARCGRRSGVSEQKPVHVLDFTLAAAAPLPVGSDRAPANLPTDARSPPPFRHRPAASTQVRPTGLGAAHRGDDDIRVRIPPTLAATWRCRPFESPSWG